MGQQQAKNMFAVVRNFRRIAMPPTGKYFEMVPHPPISQRESRRIQTGFFLDFSLRRFQQILANFLTACHRLPKSGSIRAFEQQNLQVGGMNHDQN
jgi:hypothetical protein